MSNNASKVIDAIKQLNGDKSLPSGVGADKVEKVTGFSSEQLTQICKELDGYPNLEITYGNNRVSYFSMSVGFN